MPSSVDAKEGIWLGAFRPVWPCPGRSGAIQLLKGLSGWVAMD